MTSPALPRAYGPGVLEAGFRGTPEDFRVEEIDAFAADGDGEHLLLTIEKRGENTMHVARRLARWAGIADVGIGWAGMKDRHAVTVQRFSVHLPRRVAPDLAALETPGADGRPSLRVIASAWHRRKLPRGASHGNRFTLVLREVRGDRDAIQARLQALAEGGLPNYFGEQRFGRGGDNVGNALAMFAGRRVAREQRSHLLSAARSQLFNRVLAARVERGCWDEALEGEVWMLDGSRSVFGPVPVDDTLQQRLADFDIHPTAPLWGRGALRSEAASASLELGALDDAQSLALREGLEAAGLKQERRATRLRPQALAWQWLDDTSLELRFSLPPGAYATTVLAELGNV